MGYVRISADIEKMTALVFKKKTILPSYQSAPYADRGAPLVCNGAVEPKKGWRCLMLSFPRLIRYIKRINPVIR